MKTSYPTVTKIIPLLGAGVAVFLGGCATRTGPPAPVVYHAPPSRVTPSGSTTYLQTDPAQSVIASAPSPMPASSTLPDYSTARVETPPASVDSTLPTQPQAQPLTATPSQTSVPSAQTAGNTAEQVVIPLHSEQLRVGTREVESGAVRLRKVVRTETVNQPVTLRREELVVDRLPPGSPEARAAAANGQAPDLNQPFSEQSVTIPIRREEAVVQTETVPAGEVVARKNVSTETTTVQRPLRKEDVEVVKVGDPRDVNVSPDVRSQTDSLGTAAGTAPQYQGGTARESSPEPIASLATLANARDLSELVRRPIDLANVVVREVLGRGLIALESPDGQTFYVRTPDALTAIRAGDHINLRGRLEAVPQRLQDLGLAPELERLLQGRPVYISANDIRKAILPSGR